MFRRVLLGVTPLACAAASMGLAGTASAQTGNPFSCTASTASVTLAGATLLNPLSANAANNPCANDSGAVGNTPLLAGTLSLGPANAQTILEQTTASGSTLYTGAKAISSVDALNLALPLGGLSVGITQPSAATVDYECVNNALVPSYSSTLSAITINGQTISLSGLPQNLSTAAATILVNQHTSTATSDTETLLQIQLLSGLNVGLNINVGSATVGANSSSTACSGTTPTNTTTTVTTPGSTGTNGSNGSGGSNGTSGNNGNGGTSGTGTGGSNGTSGSGTGTSGTSGSGGADGSSGSGTSGTSGSGSNGSGSNGSGSNGVAGGCPSGSSASAGVCVVTGTKIVVPSVASGDIVGGSVISLAKAKKLYKSSCLNGSGPGFVVVGTAKANKITVKTARLRVLGLAGADRINVLSGKGTCADGGVGNDVMKDSSAQKDSLFGAAGNDKMMITKGPAFASGGNGSDIMKAANKAVTLRGNNGVDKMTAGNGTDNVSGGNGSDVIFVGEGFDRVNGGAGNNRITAKGKKALVVAGAGNTVAFLQKANTVYAKAHGVKTVKSVTV